MSFFYIKARARYDGAPASVIYDRKRIKRTVILLYNKNDNAGGRNFVMRLMKCARAEVLGLGSGVMFRCGILREGEERLFIDH